MKKIIITGATGGIGTMLAAGLAKKGHQIIGIGRNAERLNEWAATIENGGGSASYQVADLTDDQMVFEAGQRIVEEYHGIDVWINNVGVNNHNAIGPTWELKPEHWWTEVSLNLYTAFVGTYTAINLMKDGGSGYIINLGGGGVQEPKAFGSAYGAAKTAVVKFTETVNLELEKKGLNIKVFAFNPGFIRNARTEKLVESEVARNYMPELERILKYGKMSDIEDSIDLITTLIGGEADHLAGRYFFADDRNLEYAITNVEDFINRHRNLLRVH